MTPKISIIIPVYNSEAFLSRCIESVLQQTFTNFELLLIDDGSSDNSGKICDRYALEDKRIRVFHKKNEGISITRNYGLKLAQGEYIGWVDSDDWIQIEMYEEMYNEIQKINADIVWCDFTFVYSDTQIYNSTINAYSNKNKLFQAYFSQKYTLLMNTLTKKAIYDQYKVQCIEGRNYSEDFYTTTKLLYYSKKYSHINKSFYFYNKLNSNSITTYDPLCKKNIEDKINNTLDVLLILSSKEKKQLEKFIYWRVLNYKRDIILNAKDKKDLHDYTRIAPQTKKYILSNPSNQGHAMKLLEYCIAYKFYNAFCLFKLYKKVKDYFR